MKILMTTDTVGGVWTYAIELARALRSSGIEIALATMGAPVSAAQRSQVQALDNVEVHESEFKLEWMDDPWADVERAGQWLLDLEARVGPAVVHLNGYAHGALPWRSPALIVAHSCVLSWWQAVKGCAAPRAAWEDYRVRVARGLHAADAVVAPSRAMLDAIKLHYGLVRGGRVIYNGRDPRLFRPRRKDRFVLAAGRIWDEAKNIAALARAAAQIPWPIRIAGDQAYPDGRAPRAAPAMRGLKYLGKLDQPQLAQQMSHASIYALPACYEPFGLSALEAAMSGCALVLGDIPSLREIWLDAAIYVSPDDPDAIAQAVGDLSRNPSRRRAMSERALMRSAGFSADRMARSYQQLYRQLDGGLSASTAAAAAATAANIAVEPVLPDASAFQRGTS